MEGDRKKERGKEKKEAETEKKRKTGHESMITQAKPPTHCQSWHILYLYHDAAGVSYKLSLNKNRRVMDVHCNSR